VKKIIGTPSKGREDNLENDFGTRKSHQRCRSWPKLSKLGPSGKGGSIGLLWVRERLAKTFLVVQGQEKKSQKGKVSEDWGGE